MKNKTYSKDVKNMNSNRDTIVFEDEELKLEVKISSQENTVWLTQRQMAELFDVSVDNVSLHIKNIFN